MLISYLGFVFGAFVYTDSALESTLWIQFFFFSKVEFCMQIKSFLSSTKVTECLAGFLTAACTNNPYLSKAALLTFSSSNSDGLSRKVIYMSISFPGWMKGCVEGTIRQRSRWYWKMQFKTQLSILVLVLGYYNCFFSEIWLFCKKLPNTQNFDSKKATQKL